MTENIANIFDENTYKRLKVINKINPLYGSELLNYCNSLSNIIFIPPKFNVKFKKAPLDAINESRFSNFSSIIDNVTMLNQVYTIDLKPHKINIYGNNVSPKYIFHVANIVNWWATIKPQEYYINIYLTNLKKQLPYNADSCMHNNHKSCILNEESINSGFTFVSSPNDIHIFRKEESLKVLLHELIHASKYDFNDNNLSELPVRIKDDNITNEGITEYIAIIHYLWYIANYLHYSIYKNIPLSELFLEVLSNDLGWQEYQINKIFMYFNMKPSDLLITNNNFKQKTSVISYYIFKNFLFNQNSIDIIMSRDIDKINALISNFSQFLVNFKSNKIMHNSLSMRMSLYEFNY
jgi:hypothetical protein